MSVPESLPSAPNMDGDENNLQTILQLVTKTIEQNQRTRTLSVDKHGAWQILHGVLAYGRDFEVQTPDGPAPVVDYLLGGGRILGFEPYLGASLGESKRPGLRLELAPDNKVSQGHRDQWLAVLCQTNLTLETELKSGDHVFTVADWLNQAEWDVPRNIEEEFSWTLIPLAKYRPTNHRWVASNNLEYSTELLLESEIDRNLELSACGGTHRLIGIAMALQKRREEGEPVTGVWQAAKELIDQCIAESKDNQNPDGSYSTAYFHRTGWVRDLGEILGTTGHVLEFLAIAADVETLQQEWVIRSVRRLCEVLEQCDGIDLECGGLYHALHGLQEYRRRLV